MRLEFWNSIVLFLCLVSSVSAGEGFFKYPAVSHPAGLKKYLADIEGHMDYSQAHGTSYRDNDKDTWAHETTHGINSVLRNMPQYGQDWGVLYLLNDDAVALKQPPTTISAVARRIPPEQRGMAYNLYLLQSQSSWNNRPLYLFDEWVAYTNCTMVGIEYGLDCASSTQQMAEFTICAQALLDEVKAHPNGYDYTKLEAFVKWHSGRTVIVCKMTKDVPSMHSRQADLILGIGRQPLLKLKKLLTPRLDQRNSDESQQAE